MPIVLAIACVILAGASAVAAPRNQWVWTQADAEALATVRASDDTVRAGVHVAELHFDGDLRTRLRLSPALVPGGGTLVVRLDDSVHGAWAALGTDTLGDQLEQRLGAILAVAARAGADGAILQLDYDCPVRLLGSWRALLARLHAGVLAGRELWVTSLVVHVRHPGYLESLRGVIAGHVLQVFDTGEEPPPDGGATLCARLEASQLPFAVGVAAFERRGAGGRHTDHGAWWPLLPRFARSTLFAGTWVFAAGQRWGPLVRSLP